MSVELLDESPDDVSEVLVAWISPLYPSGHVAVARKPGGPLPFVLINHLDSNESIQESTSDALVSVHVLTHKSAGEVASRDEADKVHRRILLLARYLEDVDLIGGRKATIDSISVFKSPKPEPYGDDQILRRLGRYTIGLPYVARQ